MIKFDMFNECHNQLTEQLSHARRVTEYWIKGLYARLYEPECTMTDLVVFYHGGGVNADAGYDILARQVSCAASTGVCLVDIRGHGRSCGERGRVTYSRQIWIDVDSVLHHVHMLFPQAKVHLMGHSSGAGMLINYFTRFMPEQKSDSVILLAPELGPFAPANIRRVTPVPFAEVQTWPFLLHSISAGLICGNFMAVKLNFPLDVRKLRPDFIVQYSVNMANALTPRCPARQLAQLPLPVTLLSAEYDELFDAQQLNAFVIACGNKNIRSRIIKNSTHLDCIFNVSGAIQQHLQAWVRQHASF